MEKAPTTSVNAQFLSAVTLDDQTVQLNINKPLADPIPTLPDGFQIFVNGDPIVINNAELNLVNTRIITFTVDYTFKSSNIITISYAGNQINATDGTPLNGFFMQPVQNTVALIHPIPGRVEAEDFFFQSGVQLESTSDVGGGQNVGFLDVGDYMDYHIDVAHDGIYRIDYRTASESSAGALQLQRINDDGSTSVLQISSFEPTGGWQDWETTSKNISLTKGRHQIRLLITQPQFNINWFEFTALTSTNEPELLTNMVIYPNPTSGTFLLEGSTEKIEDLEIQVVNLLGQLVYSKRIEQATELKTQINIEGQTAGTYLLLVRSKNAVVHSVKILKK